MPSSDGFKEIDIFRVGFRVGYLTMLAIGINELRKPEVRKDFCDVVSYHKQKAKGLLKRSRQS